VISPSSGAGRFWPLATLSGRDEGADAEGPEGTAGVRVAFTASRILLGPPPLPVPRPRIPRTRPRVPPLTVGDIEESAPAAATDVEGEAGVTGAETVLGEGLNSAAATDKMGAEGVEVAVGTIGAIAVPELDPSAGPDVGASSPASTSNFLILASASTFCLSSVFLVISAVRACFSRALIR